MRSTSMRYPPTVPPVMGVANRPPVPTMGAPGRTTHPMMGRPDAGAHIGVMGRGVRGAGSDLLGVSDPALVDQLFAAWATAHRPAASWAGRRRRLGRRAIRRGRLVGP